MTTQEDAGGLFTPDRVAVVGATDRDGAIGRAIIDNLSDFDNDVIAVNPGRDDVLG
ncbi:CoA-binding protein, partial [Halobacterium salinarum]